jgi:hypothetical protein
MGIGRPSTFASIVHTLKKREYIQCVIPNRDKDPDQTVTEHPRYFITNYGEGAISTVVSAPTLDTRRPKLRSNINKNTNIIQITPAGQRVIETLFPNCESLLAYNYTRNMEETLDEVATGNAGWVEACTDCITHLNILENKNENEPRSEKQQRQQERENENTGTKPGNGCIRTLNSYASIRDGKYGAYIFYKTPSMKKPKFISLQGFPYTYTECDIELLLHWMEKHI